MYCWKGRQGRVGAERVVWVLAGSLRRRREREACEGGLRGRVESSKHRFSTCVCTCEMCMWFRGIGWRAGGPRFMRSGIREKGGRMMRRWENGGAFLGISVTMFELDWLGRGQDHYYCSRSSLGRSSARCRVLRIPSLHRNTMPSSLPWQGSLRSG